MAQYEVAVESRQNHLSAALMGGSYDMPAVPTILIYGHDHTLLNTRRLILEKAGYRVHTAQTLTEVERIAAIEPIGLLLLCHSLSVENSEKAVISANTIQPEMKRLLLTSHKPLCGQGPIDRVLRAIDGPQALIAAVHELLPNRRTPVPVSLRTHESTILTELSSKR